MQAINSPNMKMKVKVVVYLIVFPPDDLRWFMNLSHDLFSMLIRSIHSRERLKHC